MVFSQLETTDLLSFPPQLVRFLSVVHTPSSTVQGIAMEILEERDRKPASLDGPVLLVFVRRGIMTLTPFACKDRNPKSNGARSEH